MVGNDTLLHPRLSALYGVNILNIVPGFSSNIPIKVNGIWARVNPSTQCWDSAPINLSVSYTLCFIRWQRTSVCCLGKVPKAQREGVCSALLPVALSGCCYSTTARSRKDTGIPQLRSAGCSHASGRNAALKGQGVQFTLGRSVTVIKFVLKQHLPLSQEAF